MSRAMAKPRNAETAATTMSVRSRQMRKPSFCMVLVANGEYAYRRKEDDVIVCPITLLGV